MVTKIVWSAVVAVSIVFIYLWVTRKAVAYDGTKSATGGIRG